MKIIRGCALSISAFVTSVRELLWRFQCFVTHYFAIATRRNLTVIAETTQRITYDISCDFAIMLVCTTKEQEARIHWLIHLQKSWLTATTFKKSFIKLDMGVLMSSVSAARTPSYDILFHQHFGVDSWENVGQCPNDRAYQLRRTLGWRKLVASESKLHRES